jgi:hypothetical protein
MTDALRLICTATMLFIVGSLYQQQACDFCAKRTVPVRRNMLRILDAIWAKFRETRVARHVGN